MIDGRRLGLGLASVFLLAGCGEQENLRTIQGEVAYRGAALDHGLISFFPPTGRPIGGPIGEDGRFQLELPPGDYRVAINSPPANMIGLREGEPAPPPDPNAFPARYGRPNTSGLQRTVDANHDQQTIDFALE